MKNGVAGKPGLEMSKRSCETYVCRYTVVSDFSCYFDALHLGSWVDPQIFDFESS